MAMMARIFSKLEESIIALLLVAITLLVFLEVVMRFGFGQGLLWLEELTLHLAGWFVLFGISYGVKVGAHIQVDVLVNALGQGAKRLVGIFAVASSLVYCALITYGSWIYLAKIRKYNIEMEDFEFPKWIAHSVLIIGMVLLAIRLAQLLWRTIKGEASGFEVVSEADEALESHAAGAAGDAGGEKP